MSVLTITLLSEVASEEPRKQQLVVQSDVSSKRVETSDLLSTIIHAPTRPCPEGEKTYDQGNCRPLLQAHKQSIK